MFNILVYERSNGKPFELIQISRKDYFEENMKEKNDLDYVYLDSMPDTYENLYVNTETKEVVTKSEQPSEFHIWNWEFKQWEYDSANAEAIIRAKRTTLLQDSDWTQGLDVPEDIRTTWAVYRDALRNIPQQEGFPEQVIWPTAPER